MQVRTTATQTTIEHAGTYGARVTRVAGVWGYWYNGHRTNVGPDRGEAERAATTYLLAL